MRSCLAHVYYNEQNIYTRAKTENNHFHLNRIVTELSDLLSIIPCEGFLTLLYDDECSGKIVLRENRPNTKDQRATSSMSASRDL